MLTIDKKWKYYDLLKIFAAGDSNRCIILGQCNVWATKDLFYIFFSLKKWTIF